MNATDTPLLILPTRVANLLALKGQIVTMVTHRECKTRKGLATVEKRSRFQTRIGCDYSNLKSVIEKQEAGILPAETQPLSWGEWMVFPYIIAHKGNHYMRCSVLRNASSVHDVTWYQNGVEIDREKAKQACLASEFQEDRDNDVFVVKIESIIEVNGKEV